MKVLICYDVNNDRMRYKLVKYLEKFAVRVQYSVFKAKLSDRHIKEITAYANNLLQGGTYGNLLIYKITTESFIKGHNSFNKRIETIVVKKVY